MSEVLDAELDRSEFLQRLAEEVLDAFESIADAARSRLGQTPRGPRLEAFASINQATAEKVVKALGEIQQGRELDCRKLLLQPAVSHFSEKLRKPERSAVVLTKEPGQSSSSSRCRHMNLLLLP